VDIMVLTELFRLDGCSGAIDGMLIDPTLIAMG
jgi:hypothetical protein